MLERTEWRKANKLLSMFKTFVAPKAAGLVEIQSECFAAALDDGAAACGDGKGGGMLAGAEASATTVVPTAAAAVATLDLWCARARCLRAVAARRAGVTVSTADA